ncbi:unnamed protein product [Calypogeia fissa]
MELALSSARFFQSSRLPDLGVRHLEGRKFGGSVHSFHGILRGDRIGSKILSAGAQGCCEHSFPKTCLDGKLSLQAGFSQRDSCLASFYGRGSSPKSGRRRGQHLCRNGFVGALDANAEGGEEGLGNSLVGADELQDWEKKVEKFGEVLSSAFPLWVGLACAYALVFPNTTLWLNGPITFWLLTVTMLGMGMTLTPEDFKGALAMPQELFVGVLLQYTVMPSAGFLVSRLLKLSPEFAAGLILVACCPGGTASNIVTYLARGNVALSVLMTAASTFLAVVMTPVLTAKLVGQYVNVDAAGLFASTVQVVLIPVIGGAILNYFFHKSVKKISLVSPSIAVVIVALICAGAVGRSAGAILSSGGPVVVAVLALHLIGFSWGYILARLLRIDESSARTISIEVGMQNSVLGVVLAGQHFSSPLTAVPCAVSSVCHSLIGSTLAGIWRHRPTGAIDITGAGEGTALGSSSSPTM